MDEIIGQAIKALVANWPLVAIIGWIGWKGFPWALRVHGHEAFTSEKGQKAMHTNMTNYFNNGGGEKVRQIVQSENAMQSAIHKDEINTAIRNHEAVETKRLQEQLDEALEEFRTEITGEYDLKPSAAQARRRFKARSKRR